MSSGNGQVRLANSAVPPSMMRPDVLLGRSVPDTVGGIPLAIRFAPEQLDVPSFIDDGLTIGPVDRKRETTRFVTERTRRKRKRQGPRGLPATSLPDFVPDPVDFHDEVRLHR